VPFREGVLVTRRSFRKYLPALALVALVAAVWLVWRSVREVSPADILASIYQIPVHRLALASVFAAASYATLTAFDWIGVRYAGCAGRVSYPRAALASFVSLSLGHSIGLAPLGSGAVRFRYYDSWGLDAEEIAKVVLATTATVTMGQIGFAGLVLAAAPAPSAHWLHLDSAIVRAAGGLALLVCVLYVVLAAVLRDPLRIRGWSFKLPRWRLALAQVVLGTVNFAFLAAAMHQLLATATEAPFLTVANAFVLANVAALISHVPGGLGVIEYIILSFFPNAPVFGPTLVYRTIYYLVPLAIGALVFAATAFRRRRALRLTQPA
jgi:uncharacterized membrane protein YbhN (UPF0104 family)